MIKQWQDIQNGFDDCMKNLFEDNDELSDVEVTAKFLLLESILDKHDEIRHEFDFISEEYEKRSNQRIEARRIK